LAFVSLGLDSLRRLLGTMTVPGLEGRKSQ
jgi:hypothetical protein